MTLSSKLKPPFTGTLKAKLKKILKSSDQNDVRSSSPTEGDTSGTLKGRKHQPSPLSSNVWTTECISSSTDHHPTRPSIPPPFFDASSSTTSLVAASSITCHPPDSLASTSGSSSTPHRHQVHHHHHSHHAISSSSCTTKTQSLISSPSSLTSSPSSPNSTLVPSEASFPRTPILRPKHWTRNNKSSQSKSKPKSRPILHPSTIINLPPPSPSYGSRQREYYSSTCSRVSELIANYEALALAAATTTTTTSPMIHVQRTGNNNNSNSNDSNDIDFLGFRLGNLGNSNSHTHTWSSPSSSSTLVPSSSSFSPVSPVSPVSPLMEKEKRREQEEQYHQRDQLRIRSLEKRIAELERECEEQKGTIEELREENEVFYTRLCEVSRENKKLKKRVRSVSQQPLFSLTDDSESDYGVEMHPDASTSHLDDASSSSYHHHQHQHYQYQHHHHLHPGPWNHQRDRVVSNNTTNTTNTTNSRDMETLRSDMLARPHGVFFDWCSESGSINMDASVSVVGGSDGGEEEEEKEQEEEGGGSYPPAELGDDDDDDAASTV